MGQLDDRQAYLGITLIMMPRLHPGSNKNQHKRFAQHIGSPRRGALAAGGLFFPIWYAFGDPIGGGFTFEVVVQELFHFNGIIQFIGIFF